MFLRVEWAMASVHEYPVTVQWEGGREGHGVVNAQHSGMSNNLAVPPEFQGTGNGTNPEELLTCSVASCYTITFGIIAANRKIPVESIRTEAVGQVEQNGAQLTFTSVTIRPTITLNPGATDDEAKLAEDMAHKADLYCIITNAVRDKVKINVEPNIVRS
jgi:peroxiredoxin-like protein